MGGLVLVATPIGNLEDISPRCARALAEADIWLVEDTRISGKLQSHLGLSKPMRVCNEHTSEAQLLRYVEELKGGVSAALLTDAGTPGISDPGAWIADLCYAAGVPVDAIPGPSAVATSVMLSGFFAQRFAFLGFLSRKPGPMKKELEPFADSPLTVVVFESPFRLKNLLKAASEALGERRYAVCREITKLHQQVYRSTLPDIPDDKTVPQKGEVCVVFEGKRKPKNADD
jgi:16S rRNA (cytidine1402-2'-O)-methyltransferase